VTKTPRQATASNTGKSLSKAVSVTSMGTEIASTVLSCGAMIITAGVAVIGDNRWQ